MVKITLNDNFVPYAGPMPAKKPNRVTPSDLTQNYLLARDLIRVASVLFQIQKDAAIFSGYVYDKPNSTFKIKVHHQGKFLREVTLHPLQYGGLLHIDLLPRNVESAMRFDLLAFLKEPAFREQPIGLSVD